MLLGGSPKDLPPIAAPIASGLEKEKARGFLRAPSLGNQAADVLAVVPGTLIVFVTVVTAIAIAIVAVVTVIVVAVIPVAAVIVGHRVTDLLLETRNPDLDVAGLIGIQPVAAG